MSNEQTDAKPGGFKGWLTDILSPLVKVAVDEAVNTLHDDIKADLVEMETRIFGQLTQLPGLIASQVEHVALDTEQVAEKVLGGLQGVLPGLLQGILDPVALAKQIAEEIGGGIHIPGFGLAEHQDVSISAATKAAEIRKRLEEREKEGKNP